MPNITQDSFNIDSRFTKVVFQRGKDVCDFELNELQDDFRVPTYEAIYNAVQNVPSAFGGVALNPGSNDAGWSLIGTGATNSVTIGDGWLICDGIPLIYDGVALPTTGPTFTTPGSDRIDAVYIAVTEVYAPDPNQIAALGETTLRRQIQITWGTSTTGPTTGPGTGGVPDNTSDAIWQGGIHYFPIANVTRLVSASGVITAGDITDLRFLLPPAICAQVARQANGSVVAIDTTLIETPINYAGVVKSAAMQIDLDPDNAVGGVRHLDVYSANLTGSGHHLLQVNDNTSLFIGGSAAVGQLLRPAGIVDKAAGVFSFQDVNTAANITTNKSESTVPFSGGTSANGDAFLRVGELGVNGTTPLQYSSILRRLNGRVEITCGDGISSFGDFNGETALADAMAYVATLTGVNVYSVTIILKQGVFYVTTPVTITLLNLEIRGVNAATSVVNLAGMAGSAWLQYTSVVNPGNSLKLKNVIWQAVAAGGDVTDIVGLSTASTTNPPHYGSFIAITVEDCIFQAAGMTLLNTGKTYFARCTFQPAAEVATRAWVQLFYGSATGTTNYYSKVVFNQCTMTAPNYSTSAAQNSFPQVQVSYFTPAFAIATSGQSIIEGIIFRDCSLTQGGTALSSGALITNPGIIDVDNGGLNQLSSYGSATPNGLDIQKILFDQCSVVASQVASGGECAPVLLFLRDAPSSSSTAGLTYLRSVEVAGGDWRVLAPSGSSRTVGSSEAVNLIAPPFLIASSTGEVNIHDVNGIGFPPSLSADTESVTVGPVPTDSGWWFNHQDTGAWTPATYEGAFVALCGAPLVIKNVRIKNMRQSQECGDVFAVGASGLGAPGDCLNIDGLYWDYFIPNVVGGTATPFFRLKIQDWDLNEGMHVSKVVMNGIDSGNSTDWITAGNGFITVSIANPETDSFLVMEECLVRLFTHNTTLSTGVGILFDGNYPLFGITVTKCAISKTTFGIGYGAVPTTNNAVSNVNISNNYIEQQVDYGIFLDTSTGGTGVISHLDISNNRVSSAGANGIQVIAPWSGTGDLSVSNNICTDSTTYDISLISTGSADPPAVVVGNRTTTIQANSNGIAITKVVGLGTSISGTTVLYADNTAMLMNTGNLHTPG